MPLQHGLDGGLAHGSAPRLRVRRRDDGVALDRDPVELRLDERAGLGLVDEHHGRPPAEHHAK
eukprot:13400979-Alexandrium_andersonii.AAC.1